MNLRPHLLKEAEYQRKVFYIQLEADTTLDDVLRPAFWAHVARRLKPRARIEVHPADGSWFAELIVLAASHISASVAVLNKVDLAAADLTGDILDHEVKHRGRAGWSAVRKSDHMVVVEGLPSKQAVIDWLKKPTPVAQAA